jgi:DNA-binding response OmpR family regulator
MNVLIADDDAVTRLMLNSALGKLGHTVYQAENGREAWETWQRDHYSLVISDWMMPDIDGLELCRRIRCNERTEFTYVILLTSRTGKTNYLQAMDAGVDDFMSKPFDKDQLVARVRVATRILELHRSLSLANTDLERRVQERTAELEKAMDAKSEFLSRASHELRTPMNHILGFAQLLEFDELKAEQQESVEHILTSGHRLLRLIDRILAVSESASGDLGFLEGENKPELEGAEQRMPVSLATALDESAIGKS